jgi:hypothetical protein
MQDLGYTHSVPRGVTVPKDVATREANRINNERLWAWKQRKWAWSAAWVATRASGGGGGRNLPPRLNHWEVASIRRMKRGR